MLLANDWVERGIFIHHTYLPSADKRLIDAWFSLDFGKERVNAILEFNKIEITEIKIPDGIRLHRSQPGDNERLGGMSHLIMGGLEKSPYFHPAPLKDFPELYDGWSELANDKAVDIWFAIKEGHTVATVAAWQ